MRRVSSSLLVSSCATGLLLAVSYLGESPTQASSSGEGSFGPQVARVIETRQGLSAALQERARTIAYGLERAKNELEDLIP